MSFAFTLIQTVQKTPEKVWTAVIMGNIANTYSSTVDSRDELCSNRPESLAKAVSDFMRVLEPPQYPVNFDGKPWEFKKLWDRQWIDDDTLQFLNYFDSLQDAQNWYLNYFSRPFVPYTSGYYSTNWKIVDANGDEQPLPEITWEWKRSKEFVDPEFTPT